MGIRRDAFYDELGYLVHFELPCICDYCKQLEREAEENRRQSRVRRVAHYLKRSGIPPRFTEFTLKTSPCKAESRRLSEAGPSSSFVLWGAAGRGKTSLACAYLQSWIRAQCRPGVFIPTPKLLGELRRTYGGASDEQAVIERYAEVPLLVLDDLGAEAVANIEWLADRLYQIVGHRHDYERPTFVTSNLSPQQLSQRVGERIWWRIAELCGKSNVLCLDGTNLRRQ